MKDLEQRVKELETIVEYVFEGQKNINKQFDSFAEEFQQHSDNYADALKEISDVKMAVMRYFVNTAGNATEDSIEYREAEGLDQIPIQDIPLQFEDMMKDFAKEHGIDYDDMTEKMFFKNQEDMEVFNMAYTLLANINPILDPQDLYDTLMNFEM